MIDDLLSRRSLLNRTLRLTGGFMVLPMFVGCSGGGDDGKAAAGLPDCPDAKGLSTGERSLRASLHYVDMSPHEGERNCSNCYFFTAASRGACGSCETVKGPINPLGYCNAWTARVS